MQNPESVKENEKHKLIWDFKMKRDHLISARQTNPVINDQKVNLQNYRLCFPGGPRSKIEKKCIEG